MYTFKIKIHCMQTNTHMNYTDTQLETFLLFYLKARKDGWIQFNPRTNLTKLNLVRVRNNMPTLDFWCHSNVRAIELLGIPKISKLIKVIVFEFRKVTVSFMEIFKILELSIYDLKVYLNLKSNNLWYRWQCGPESQKIMAEIYYGSAGSQILKSTYMKQFTVINQFIIDRLV